MSKLLNAEPATWTRRTRRAQQTAHARSGATSRTRRSINQCVPQHLYAQICIHQIRQTAPNLDPATREESFVVSTPACSAQTRTMASTYSPRGGASFMPCRTLLSTHWSMSTFCTYMHSEDTRKRKAVQPKHTETFTSRKKRRDAAVWRACRHMEVRESAQ